MPFSRKSAASSGSRFSIEVEIRCGQIAQQAGVATTRESPIRSTVNGLARAGFLASRRPGFYKIILNSSFFLIKNCQSLQKKLRTCNCVTTTGGTTIVGVAIKILERTTFAMLSFPKLGLCPTTFPSSSSSGIPFPKHSSLRM